MLLYFYTPFCLNFTFGTNMIIYPGFYIFVGYFVDRCCLNLVLRACQNFLNFVCHCRCLHLALPVNNLLKTYIVYIIGKVIFVYNTRTVICIYIYDLRICLHFSFVFQHKILFYVSMSFGIILTSHSFFHITPCATWAYREHTSNN